MQTKYHSISCCCRLLITLPILFALASCGSPPPNPPATIHVQTTPSDAEIMVDGIYLGTTPMTVPDLEAGDHFLVLQKESHVRLNEQIFLESGQTLELNFNLKHHTGQISMRTDPPGAQVHLNLDGRTIDLGETPIENAELDTGTYSFEMVHPDYHPIEGEFAIHRRGIYNEDHRLKAYNAKLHVFSRPTGADIWVNEEKWPERTPTTLNLSAGEYTIGIYKLGYNLNEEVIQLSPNDSYSHNPILKEGYMPLGMVLVPAGEFIFGDDNKSPDEKPMKKLHLESFFIDKFEVTNAQFKQIFQNHTFPEGHGNRPVRGITWKQANQYAKALNKRLPTEREWEKAARGSTGKEFPWGSLFQIDHANIKDYDPYVAKVGQYKEGISPYGCFDMAGNVYEWVNDWYNPYPGNTEVLIDYGSIYRVLRGGSFDSDPFEVRGAKRHYDRPDTRRQDYGFRCAQGIPERMPENPGL